MDKIRPRTSDFIASEFVKWIKLTFDQFNYIFKLYYFTDEKRARQDEDMDADISNGKWQFTFGI